MYMYMYTSGVRYEVYFGMWTYLIRRVLSEPLGSECSEHSAAPLARCGKYRGISNYSVVDLLQFPRLTTCIYDSTASDQPVVSSDGDISMLDCYCPYL